MKVKTLAGIIFSLFLTQEIAAAPDPKPILKKTPQELAQERLKNFEAKVAQLEQTGVTASTGLDLAIEQEAESMVTKGSSPANLWLDIGLKNLLLEAKASSPSSTALKDAITSVDNTMQETATSLDADSDSYFPADPTSADISAMALEISSMNGEQFKKAMQDFNALPQATQEKYLQSDGNMIASAIVDNLTDPTLSPEEFETRVDSMVGQNGESIFSPTDGDSAFTSLLKNSIEERAKAQVAELAKLSHYIVRAGTAQEQEETKAKYQQKRADYFNLVEKIETLDEKTGLTLDDGLSSISEAEALAIANRFGGNLDIKTTIEEQVQAIKATEDIIALTPKESNVGFDAAALEMDLYDDLAKDAAQLETGLKTKVRSLSLGTLWDEGSLNTSDADVEEMVKSQISLDKMLKEELPKLDALITEKQQRLDDLKSSPGPHTKNDTNEITALETTISKLEKAQSKLNKTKTLVENSDFKIQYLREIAKLQAENPDETITKQMADSAFFENYLKPYIDGLDKFNIDVATEVDKTDYVNSVYKLHTVIDFVSNLDFSAEDQQKLDKAYAAAFSNSLSIASSLTAELAQAKANGMEASDPNAYAKLVGVESAAEENIKRFVQADMKTVNALQDSVQDGTASPAEKTKYFSALIRLESVDASEISFGKHNPTTKKLETLLGSKTTLENLESMKSELSITDADLKNLMDIHSLLSTEASLELEMQKDDPLPSTSTATDYLDTINKIASAMETMGKLKMTVPDKLNTQLSAIVKNGMQTLSDYVENENTGAAEQLSAENPILYGPEIDAMDSLEVAVKAMTDGVTITLTPTEENIIENKNLLTKMSSIPTKYIPVDKDAPIWERTAQENYNKLVQQIDALKAEIDVESATNPDLAASIESSVTDLTIAGSELVSLGDKPTPTGLSRITAIFKKAIRNARIKNRSSYLELNDSLQDIQLKLQKAYEESQAAATVATDTANLEAEASETTQLENKTGVTLSAEEVQAYDALQENLTTAISDLKGLADTLVTRLATVTTAQMDIDMDGTFNEQVSNVKNQIERLNQTAEKLIRYKNLVSGGSVNLEEFVTQERDLRDAAESIALEAGSSKQASGLNALGATTEADISTEQGEVISHASSNGKSSPLAQASAELTTLGIKGDTSADVLARALDETIIDTLQGTIDDLSTLKQSQYGSSLADIEKVASSLKSLESSVSTSGTETLISKLESEETGEVKDVIEAASHSGLTGDAATNIAQLRENLNAVTDHMQDATPKELADRILNPPISNPIEVDPDPDPDAGDEM